MLELTINTARRMKKKKNKEEGEEIETMSS